MSDKLTKVNISIGDNVWEFSGSETFVQKQINEFKELICGNLKPVKAKKLKDKPTGGQSEQVVSSETKVNPYPNVIDYHGDTIGILKTKGKTKREKTRELVLMYAWAKKQLGIESVHSKELIALCKEHESYDAPNFKYTLKEASGIAIDGSERSYSVRLTVPGLSKAKKLLDTLEGETNN